MVSDTVQQIKDRLSIVDVVSGYVKLERAGVNMKARCPFHAEKTPSFIVSPDRGTYHCFGCNVGGDIFSFVEAIEGVDFKGALKILAERAGVELVYARGEKKDEKERLFEVMEVATLFYQSHMNDAAREYLFGRGLTEATVHAFRIGYAGDGWGECADHLRGKNFSEKEILDAGLAKRGERGLTDKFRNRIMFPIADNAGRIVAFSGRTFGEKAHPDAPKYLNSPETALYHKSRILYGFDRARQSIRKHNFAILVEGQMDLMLSHQAGWSNTVAVSGTAFTVEHAALLKRMSENLVIALDADEAGFKAAARAARAALQQGLNVKIAQLPRDSDPADFILKEGREAWRARIREAKDIILFLLDVLEERSKAPDQFRRSVEAGVLPFLHDIQSPIAREQYEKDIADRLHVSKEAVRATLRTVPRPLPPKQTAAETKKTIHTLPHATLAFGMLLWQETLPKPELSETFAHDLEEAVGASVFQQLRALPPSEKEKLRFRAENHAKMGRSLAKDIQALLNLLRRERLQEEMRETTKALEAAEARGDEEKTKKLLEASRVLTSQIAKYTKE